MQQPAAPSFLKACLYALATVAVSTCFFGSLWLQAETEDEDASALTADAR